MMMIQVHKNEKEKEKDDHSFSTIDLKMHVHVTNHSSLCVLYGNSNIIATQTHWFAFAWVANITVCLKWGYGLYEL